MEIKEFRMNKIVTKSGRLIQRHPNGEGSVLEFSQYGTRASLFIPDAKFRDFTPRRLLENWDQSTVHPEFRAKNNFFLLGEERDSTKPLRYQGTLSDGPLSLLLDDKVKPSLKFDLSAQGSTDNLLRLEPQSEACQYARSLVPSGLRPCDIPNLYELAVIWIESDNLDKLDPTVKDHPSNRLGYPSRFTDYFWSGTELAYGDLPYGSSVSYLGEVGPHNRYAKCSVLPVIEL